MWTHGDGFKTVFARTKQTVQTLKGIWWVWLSIRSELRATLFLLTMRIVHLLGTGHMWLGQHTERQREQKWTKKREGERESRSKMLPDLEERQREIIKERLSSDMSSASCFTDDSLLIDALRRPETVLLRTWKSKLGEPLQLRCRECEIKHSFVEIFWLEI